MGFMPLISVIIPVYNVEKYLDRCISSVVKQTYENIDIILVNDGSTDSSGEICDRWSKRDRRVRSFHKTNGGLSDARNYGLTKAAADYITYIDSDDYVHESLFERLYDILNKTESDISIVNPVHVKEGQEAVFCDKGKLKIYSNPESAIEALLYQNDFLVSAWGKLYKKRILEGTPFPKGKLFEDAAVMPYLFNKCSRIAYESSSLYAYVHRSGSITTSSFTERDCYIVDICRQYKSDFSGVSPDIDHALEAFICTCYLRVCLNAPSDDDYRKLTSDCDEYISNHWKSVFHNKLTRRKSKYGLWMYSHSKLIARLIHRGIPRWK